MGNQALRRYRLFPFVIIHHKTDLLLQKGESLKITTSEKSVLEPEEYFLKAIFDMPRQKLQFLTYNR